MREVSLALWIPGRAPDDVFTTLADYARYPALTDAVIRVEIKNLADDRQRCTWEVRFRRGVLIWTEDSVSYPDRRRIEFSLVGGDLDHQRGHWQVDGTADGSTVRFWCEFDLGLPSLAELIEPVAADTLRDNMVEICVGLFDTVEPLPQAEAAGGGDG